MDKILGFRALTRTEFISSYKLKDGEFLREGLPYCGKCKEPRFAFPVDGEDWCVSVKCRCQRDEISRKKREKAQELRMERLASLKTASLMGREFENATFETCKHDRGSSFEEAWKLCKNYCLRSGEFYDVGVGIYLCGNRGVGKTHLAHCIANSLIKQEKPVLVTSVYKIAEQIRSTFGSYGNNKAELFMSRLAKVDFLIIDDFGAETLSKNGESNWLQEKLFEVINDRYNDKKPTIFTSNYSITDLGKSGRITPRLYDRIIARCKEVKIIGSSQRNFEFEEMFLCK